MNNHDLQDPSPRSSSDIQTDIEDTRKRMDSTLDQLSNRLTPRSLVNTAMDWWDENNAGHAGKAGMQKTYRIISTQVKKHPAPSLLIGAGLAWLFLKSDEDQESILFRNRLYPDVGRGGGFAAEADDNAAGKEGGIIQTIKEKAGEAKESIVDLIQGARQKADRVADEATDLSGKAKEAYETGKDTMRTQYDNGLEQLKSAVEDYPLAVGAAFLALGALAGVILPASRREDRMMGPKSDELIEEVKQQGQELLELGKQRAGELGKNLVAEAESHGITAETVGNKLTEVTAQAGGVLREAVDGVATTLKDQTQQDDPENEGNNNALNQT